MGGLRRFAKKKLGHGFPLHFSLYSYMDNLERRQSRERSYR